MRNNPRPGFSASCGGAEMRRGIPPGKALNVQLTQLTVNSHLMFHHFSYDFLCKFESGGSCLREVIAYLLDTNHHAGVPQTTLVKCFSPKFSYIDRNNIYPKLGSMQAFTQNEGVADDYSKWQSF